MSLKDEIVFDEFGFPTPDNTPAPSDNGVLFLSQLHILLKNLGQHNTIDFGAFLDKVRPCIFMSKDTVGLLHRQPWSLSQDGPDNLIGLCAASKELGTAHAQFALKYGQSTFPRYVYNQAEPGKFTFSAWLGRQPGLIGFMKMCAGQKANVFEKLCLYAGIVLASKADKGETSNRLLTEMIVRSMDAGFFGRLVRKYWDAHVQNTYGGVNGLVQIYFQGSHPYKKYWS